ncbi:MAG TPA: hypothetical protein VI216_08300 [Candidatus Acidoferrales bacterium]
MIPRPIYVGQFSNMTFTEEHSYGVSVALWRQGPSVFGLLDDAEGLAGDTPTGVLDDVKFDSSNGKISFSAKLTMGLHTCAQHKVPVPSRDLFKFEGTLAIDRLEGTLTRFDAWHMEQTPQTDRVTLNKLDEVPLIEARSYAEWRMKVDEILKFRGPKW